MTDYYAVIGNPVDHSISPLIHEAFALQTGEDIAYNRIFCELDSFTDTVNKFFIKGGSGLNVTLPFKTQAYAMSKKISDYAKISNSVNTLTIREGEIFGDSTDGIGLIKDLCINNKFNLNGSRVLLIGAGGASRGVIIPLLDKNPKEIVITNRTLSKATELASYIPDIRVKSSGFNELKGMQFDLIINATSVSLANEELPIPSDCLNINGWVYDMMYGNEPTNFMKWGIRNHAEKVLDGFGMLVEQAAESFSLWRGVKPDTKLIIENSSKFFK